MIGGRGGIRTHGGFPHARFRVECLKPDSATLPLRKKNVEPSTSNIERPTQVSRRRSGLRAWLDLVWRVRSRAMPALADGVSASRGAKNVTILHLPCPPKLLHLVCPHGQPRYYLLLTDIHRFLAPLFTSIPSLFEPQPLSYRHDSTQTRNSARVTK